MASPTLKCLILLYLSSLFILPSSSFPITLQLSRKIRNTHSSKTPGDLFSEITKATLKRAYHLRHGNKHPSTSSTTPLYPISNPLEYVISLSLGTPPQNLPVVFDTGSSLVWVPCTTSYNCTNCTLTEANSAVFKPKRSSSKRSVNCSNKKCGWLESSGSCPGCSNCRKPCAYIQPYGLGITLGHAISDNLNLQDKVIPDFFVGCSSYSDYLPQGIVGFGRSPESLPNQINLDKFSYCLVSHNFDDTSKHSRLILGDSGDVQGMKYTPLLKNPSMEPYNEFYYVQLEGITVGKHVVKLPKENLVPDINGNGGTVVDSGSTLTTIDSTLFDPVVKEFMAQMTPAQREGVEFMPPSLSGNTVCVNVTGLQRLDFPEIVFHFKGGAKMDMGVANYYDNGGNQLCLPFANTTTVLGPPAGSGPAMILGNYQQFDFHIEFDLKKQRLGVKRQNCDLFPQ